MTPLFCYCHYAIALLSEYAYFTNPLQLVSGPSVVPESPANVVKYVTQGLLNLKVNLRTNTKVTESTELANGQQELTLSNGEKLTTDLYIPTFGLVPNSSFIPEKYRDSNGFVVVDEYLKVKGAGDVWAIGDVNNVEWSQFINCDKQSATVGKNIVKILSNKAPLPYKVATSRKKNPPRCWIGLWLIFYRVLRSSDWQETSNRLLRNYEASNLYCRQGSEKSFYREFAGHR